MNIKGQKNCPVQFLSQNIDGYKYFVIFKNDTLQWPQIDGGYNNVLLQK